MTDPRYQLLKDFQAEWPYERIQRMTLKEYTNRNKNSFCYWLEAKSKLSEFPTFQQDSNSKSDWNFLVLNVAS